jgi:7-keto-8-aminopelargonate synthetase-like enzyme
MAALREPFDQLPSTAQYYPTLHSPSRETVSLRFRSQKAPEQFTNFASSNYLNLNRRPEVKHAYLKAFEEHGSGSNGSPVLSGFYEPHAELEAALTELHETEDTVLFSSGYTANLSVLSACLGPEDLFLFDERIHGSLIDGAKLAQTRMRSFAHNDPDDLRRLLQRLRPTAGTVIVGTLGVFSMSGEVPPLPEIVQAAREHDALVLLDEAHAVGVLGKRARGTLEHFELPARSADMCVGTLSKTFAGIGGYVSGSRELTEHLRFGARPHVLSAAIPPTAAAGCAAAVKVLAREGEALGSELRRKADLFRSELRRGGLELLGEGTGVAAFSVPEAHALWHATQYLLDRGVFLNPVIYPAVRKDEGRMRYYINVDHSEDDLKRAASLTLEAVRKLDLSKPRARRSSVSLAAHPRPHDEASE